MVLKCSKPGGHSQGCKMTHSSENPNPRRGQRQALLSPQRKGRSQSGNSKGFPPLLLRYEPRQDRREASGRFGQYLKWEFHPGHAFQTIRALVVQAVVRRGFTLKRLLPFRERVDVLSRGFQEAFFKYWSCRNLPPGTVFAPGNSLYGAACSKELCTP
jgi:hypothetical protein